MIENNSLPRGVNSGDIEEVSDGIDIYQGEKLDTETPFRLGSVNQLAENSEEIYESYAKAMSRRDREPLEKDRFLNHFFGDGSIEPTFYYGNEKSGYALGVINHEIFIPTHFAPVTLRGGYNLMKELGESKQVSAMMAITPDLIETISKLPSWKYLELSGLLSNFRDETVEKGIVYNSHPETPARMDAMLVDYIESFGSVRQDNDRGPDDIEGDS